MRRIYFAALSFVIFVQVSLPVGVAQARDLSFDERVRHQKTIEDFYRSYRNPAGSSGAPAMSQEAIEGKVRRYLKESLALDRFWQTGVTADALEREMRRIARNTKFPGRLRRLYEALGNDPFVVAECVGRPTLVGRLVRNLFAMDRRIHAAAYGEALAFRARLAAGGVDGGLSPGVGMVVEYRRARSGEASAGPKEGGPPALSPDGSGRTRQVELSPAEFSRLRGEIPQRAGEVGPVVETREAFIVRGLVVDAGDTVWVSTHVFRKRSWEDWWNEVEGQLDERLVRPVASEAVLLPLPSFAPVEDQESSSSLGTEGGCGIWSAAGCAPDDTWDNGSLDDVIERTDPTLVWTGTEMIVWGGEHNVWGDPFYLSTGGRYDPVLDTWAPVSNVGAPAARDLHTAVWTGREMIVWGGRGNGLLDSGARYDPLADRWTPTSTANAPRRRMRHTAVWTGKEMIVWGGWDGSQYTNTGGRYDPDLDRWLPLSTVGAPEGRRLHTAVWTGKEMIVWGGLSGQSIVLNTGGRYDPESDTWTPTTLTGTPSPRFWHTAVWTGTRMIVWGGSDNRQFPELGLLGDGHRYDPVTDTWAPITNTGGPSPRYGHTAVWSGSEMIVWGGALLAGTTNDGGRYDPVRDLWRPTSRENAPPGLARHEAVWTGTEMIVWGQGESTNPPLNTGARYDPATDSWRPTSTGDGPSERERHTAVWTGSEMIVWGGWWRYLRDGYLDTGARYDPLLDAWFSMTVAGAPRGRAHHTAVWTGSEMIVWGGYYYDALGRFFTVNSGGRYDPALDTWRPTTLTGAPTARSGHTAVWTGDRVLVWGGEDQSGNKLATGGRYDPARDTWSPISTSGAPTARGYHTAVWTGSRMVVWGGQGAVFPLNTGGRYNPVSDSWQPTATTGAPQARFSHTAVWTGSRMVVWGGLIGSAGSVNTGGKYDPVADSWVPTSVTNAPGARHLHTAVWTGSEMVVWGGDPFPNSFNTELNSGGRYDPAADIWRPTSTRNAPFARDYHTAVWTGNHMIVWGGGVEDYKTGGRYAVGNPDADSDGVADACDCAPANGGATEVPSEVRDLRVGRDKVTLTWYSAASGAGQATVHDVLRSFLAELPVGAGPSETCVAAGVAEARAEDPETPGSGQGFGYLVRGRNSCGIGTYGFASDGTERLSMACP